HPPTGHGHGHDHAKTDDHGHGHDQKRTIHGHGTSARSHQERPNHPRHPTGHPQPDARHRQQGAARRPVTLGATSLGAATAVVGIPWAVIPWAGTPQRWTRRATPLEIVNGQGHSSHTRHHQPTNNRAETISTNHYLLEHLYSTTTLRQSHPPAQRVCAQRPSTAFVARPCDRGAQGMQRRSSDDVAGDI
ncbi:MAG: hypothetical protein QG671_4113, partial [Actinomycetota bacterium]|nr:hypothetical protein [Actinomycetota bacterium]